MTIKELTTTLWCKGDGCWKFPHCHYRFGEFAQDEARKQYVRERDMKFAVPQELPCYDSSVPDLDEDEHRAGPPRKHHFAYIP